MISLVLWDPHDVRGAPNHPKLQFSGLAGEYAWGDLHVQGTVFHATYFISRGLDRHLTVDAHGFDVTVYGHDNWKEVPHGQDRRLLHGGGRLHVLL